MIIAITGSVGSGKTSVSKLLLKELNKDFENEELTILKQQKYELINLNEEAIKYKIEDVKNLQTFDFDIDKFVFEFNKFLSQNQDKNIIIEGHFAHFLNPDLIDILFVINRDLLKLKEEYYLRGYNDKKIKDNLEVESFNLCFYEAIEEGFEENEKVFLIDNNNDYKNSIVQIIGLLDQIKILKE